VIVLNAGFGSPNMGSNPDHQHLWRLRGGTVLILRDAAPEL
jgi:hypothetical protein